MLALLPGCAPLATLPAPRVEGAPGQPWRAEREAVVAQINSARAEARLAPLAYDVTLERVGNTHCEVLVTESGEGHFSRSGVPPYLRYFLAGGHGFHRENATMYSSTLPLAQGALGGILARSVASMLAEVPPDDGHRRALLDRDVTHIGVGLAARGGEVRMTHELATEAATAWSAPPSAAKPRTGMVLAGKLARQWRAAAAEVLWEPLPEPLSDIQARVIRSYSYPERRVLYQANRAESGGGPAAIPFTVDRFGNFALRWSTGPAEGVEIAVILAMREASSELVPVAASATVVTVTGDLPPELVLWRRLAVPIAHP